MPVAVIDRVWDVTVRPHAVQVEPQGGGPEVTVVEDVVHVVHVAAQGLQGPPGETDDYLFTQAAPAALWTINHNLGRRPNVEVRSAGGVVMVGQVTHVSDNQVQVAFAAALAGSARLI